MENGDWVELRAASGDRGSGGWVCRVTREQRQRGYRLALVKRRKLVEMGSDRLIKVTEKVSERVTEYVERMRRDE